MLKLSAPPEAFRSGFRKNRAQAFTDIVTQPGFDPNASTGLPWARRFVDHLQNNLDTLLIGKPADLVGEIGKIEADPQFRLLAAYCMLAKPPKNHGMRPLYELIKELFDYGAMYSDPEYGAYALVKVHQRRICPYCQMHHLNFHVAPGKKNFKLRPPLDHFYPRSVYPYLGTSLYNLIPSCEQCNSRIKLSKDPRGAHLGAPLAHPFDSTSPLSFVSGWTSRLPAVRISSGKDFAFRFAGIDVPSNDFATFFHLQERYDWYEHELLDLIKRYRRYADLDAGLRATIDPLDFILGFPPGEARNRSIGLMLNDAAQQIVASQPPVGRKNNNV